MQGLGRPCAMRIWRISKENGVLKNYLRGPRCARDAQWCVFCNKHFHLCNFYCYDKKTRNIDQCTDFCLRFRSTICPVRLSSSPDLCSDSVCKRGSTIDNPPPWLFILREHIRSSVRLSDH